MPNFFPCVYLPNSKKCCLTFFQVYIFQRAKSVALIFFCVYTYTYQRVHHLREEAPVHSEVQGSGPSSAGHLEHSTTIKQRTEYTCIICDLQKILTHLAYIVNGKKRVILCNNFTGRISMTLLCGICDVSYPTKQR